MKIQGLKLAIGVQVALYLILPYELLGKIRKLEIQGGSRLEYSYQDVCHSFGYRDNILVDRVSYTKLDCMGKIASVGQFCQSKHGHSPLYLRGHLPKQGKAICEKGLAVTLEYDCPSSQKGICKSAKNSCSWLGRSFAANLALTSAKKVGQAVVCEYYAIRDERK